MKMTTQSHQNLEQDDDIGVSYRDDVDDQIKKLNAAIAAVADSKLDHGVPEKSPFWQSPLQLLFHAMMALPLVFEIYYLTHPLMFRK